MRPGTRLAAQDPTVVVINRENMELHERPHLLKIIEASRLPLFTEIAYEELKR